MNNLELSIIAAVSSIVFGFLALRSSRMQTSWRFPVTLLTVGWAIGNLSRTLRPFFRIGNVHVEALVTLAVLLVLCVWLLFDAVRETPWRAVLRFQLNLLGLWASFVSGWCSIHGKIWGDLLVVSIAWWIGCSIAGGGIVHVCSRRRMKFTAVLNSADKPL